MTKHSVPNLSFTAVPWYAYLLSDSGSWFSQVPSSHMQGGLETSSSVLCTHYPDFPQILDIRAGGVNHGISVSFPSQSLLCKARWDNQQAKWTQLLPLPLKATWLPCQPVTSIDNEWRSLCHSAHIPGLTVWPAGVQGSMWCRALCTRERVAGRSA